MKWRVAWPDSLSGWCFWASFVALVVVIGMSLAAPLTVVAGADGAVDVLWKAAQLGFAALVATFLLGVASTLVGNIRSQRGGGWRP